MPGSNELLVGSPPMAALLVLEGTSSPGARSPPAPQWSAESASAQREKYNCARNDFGHTTYDGPAPPRGHGLHHYHFKVAALDIEKVDVHRDRDADDLWQAVEPHILAAAETIGTYQR